MLFLLKKILPQLFISVILKDKKNVLKSSIYRGDKLISNNEKTFDKSENLLIYVKNLSKNFLFYHTALLLNTKEQGLIPNTNIKDYQSLNTTKSDIQNVLLNNALAYTATQDVKHYSELFENYKGLDFLYSPFALLFYNIQKEEQNNDKIVLYAFKQDHFLAIIVAKGTTILYGDFKIFTQELDLEFEALKQTQEIENKHDDEISLDNFNENLNNKLIISNEQTNLNTLNDNDEINLDELNQFNSDMELCHYIITSIENFYNNDKYFGVFINDIVLYSQLDMNMSAIDFLKNETFLEIKTKQIDVLDLMIELMRKELQ